MAEVLHSAEVGTIGEPMGQAPDTTTILHLKNELASSSSPYLRSHKDNLVAWQEWSPKSIALAKTHERPIFLSIGYSACHWCHVMAHESFESPEIAALLNEAFVPVKVDRESRPDLDDIYMSYVTATTGSGGWPLNVFLTPDLQPLFGGTYWPSPSSEATLSKPGNLAEDRPLNFLDIVQKIQDIWRNERAKCLASAADITHQLRAFAAEGIHAHSSVHVKGVDEENEPPEPLELDLLDDALDHFVARYDSQHGGFASGAASGGAKFPTPSNLTFLLRVGASITRPSTHTRFGFPNPIPGILGKKSCATAASMALHTLQSMSRSGLRDHIGNGFHRYSVTPDWNMPHFEKMLYDNAQLLAVYCDAWALARDPEILGTIYDLVEYLTSLESPIVRKDGGWYASENADSIPSLAATDGQHQEKREGAFYIWTTKELQSVLGDRDSSIVARHFGIQEHGNIPRELDVKDEFISQNVLHIDATPSVLAKEFGLREEEIVKVIKDGKKKLVEYRKKTRAAPEIDDKVILSWNALAVIALIRAANTLAAFDETRSRISREGAIRGAAFVKAKMFDPQTGRLTRIYSDRSSSIDGTQGPAFVDDYAYLIQSLRTLFDLTSEQHYLDWAFQLQATLDEDFHAGPNGGYFQATTASSIDKAGIVSPDTSLGRIAGSLESSDGTTNGTQPTTASPELLDQILNLKPGTDNALPSPNGIIAINLFYLSSYASALNAQSATPNRSAPTSTTIDADTNSPLSTSLLARAQTTINAFAPEIIQHPFLYASLLSSVVLSTVGIKSLLIPSTSEMDDQELESRGLRGFGRTVVRSANLRKGEILVCEHPGSRDKSTSVAGEVCRLLKEGELEDMEDGFEEDEGAVPEVAPEIIERREEMARRESLAIETERMRSRSLSQSGNPLVDVPPTMKEES